MAGTQTLGNLGPVPSESSPALLVTKEDDSPDEGWWKARPVPCPPRSREMSPRVGPESKPALWAVLFIWGFAEPLGSGEVPQEVPRAEGLPCGLSAEREPHTPSFPQSSLDLNHTWNVYLQRRFVNKMLLLKIKVGESLDWVTKGRTRNLEASRTNRKR